MSIKKILYIILFFIIFNFANAEENLKRDTKIEYIYNYDNQNRIETINKSTNGITEIFRYEYKTY